MANMNSFLSSFPRKLYTAEELLHGFVNGDPASYVKTWDFRAFAQYVKDGGSSPASLDVRLRQAEHDSYMSDALRRYLIRHESVVGIMGGHNLLRSDDAFAAIATLARSLAQNGFLVVTGGGPGAMEAAHLGAAFSGAGNGVLERALEEIRKVPKLPNLQGLLNPDGTIAPGQEENIREAHQWLFAALKAKALAPKFLGESLAIPTWLYGQEPTTPLATSYAKYFQNSIREESLITNARAGVVYAQGGGGTLREIFQDMEQNYYAQDATHFTPMIFFDPGGYWKRDAQYNQNGGIKIPGIKIDDTVKKIVRFARAAHADADQCLFKIRFTVNIAEILDVLKSHAPVAMARMRFLLKVSDTDSVQ
jgi:predicted Rossmann-fold nucleotide-binding protein